LGDTIEEIATTKLHAMQKNLIVGKQKFDKIKDIALKLASLKGANIYMPDELLDTDDILKIKQISKKLDLVPYLVQNLNLAVCALRFFDINYDVNSFENSKLFGRLSRVDENILVDVGHNPLAAKSILSALNGGRYTLIYNSYKDKDYKEILSILKPIIHHVEIIDIDDSRIEEKELLQNTLNSLGIEYTSFHGVNDRFDYLVFGSFSVVENFLKAYNE
jgi:dihydrofolate synthase/folylpolyglutamate synthase